MSLRRLSALSLLCCLGACTTTPPVTPRHYLDEQTTATITVVADPISLIAIRPPDPGRWSRDQELQRKKDRNQDYLDFYGVDVNRMGSHRQYIAMVKWVVPQQSADASPVVLLQMGSDTLELRDPENDAKSLGMVQPLAVSFSGNSRWWYFPTDAATLKRIAAAPELGAQLTLGETQTPYKLARDGRAQLNEFTTVLPK
ncbi:MAG TPA: hypothetical protein VKB34_19675 [Povalibacter sp.]|nr:hypothetical protein [Povalibacter sp.]